MLRLLTVAFTTAFAIERLSAQAVTSRDSARAANWIRRATPYAQMTGLGDLSAGSAAKREFRFWIGMQNSGYGYVVRETAAGDWWGVRVQRSAGTGLVMQQAPDSADLPGIWEALHNAGIPELIARENVTLSERAFQGDALPTSIEFWENGRYTPGIGLNLREDRPAGRTLRPILARLRHAWNIP